MGLLALPASVWAQDGPIPNDPAPPTVTRSIPGDGASTLPLAFNKITIDFSENVDIDAGAVSIDCTAITSTTPPLPASATDTLQVTLDGPLPANSTCTVTLDADRVIDADTTLLDGNGDGDPGDDYSFSFTTGVASGLNSLTSDENINRRPSIQLGASSDPDPAEFITTATTGTIPALAYIDNDEQLHVLRCNDASCNTFSDNIVNTASPFIDPVLLLPSSNNPILVYQADELNNILVSVCADAACTSVIDTNIIGSGSDLAAALDGDLPVVAYATTSDAILYNCNDASCSGGLSIPLGVGDRDRIELALKDDGSAVVLSAELGKGNTSDITVCQVKSCGSGVRDTTNISGNPGSDMANRAVLALDGNIPVIGYYSFTEGALALYRCDNAACTSGGQITLSGLGNANDPPGLAFNSAGQPVLSYVGAGSGLGIVVCHDDVCSAPADTRIDTGGETVLVQPNLILDGDNNPYITYNAGFTSLYLYAPSVAFTPEVDLELEATLNPDPVTLDGNATLSVTVTNNANSNAPANGVQVEVVAPLSDTVVTSNDASATSGTFNAGTGIWDLGPSLAPGETRTLTLNVGINPSASTPLDFSGQIIAPSPGDDPDSTPNNFTGTPAEDDEFLISASVAVVTPEADLALTGNLAPASVNEGDTLVLSVTLSNDASSDTSVSGLLVEAEYPGADVTYDSDNAASLGDNIIASTDFFQWTVNSLPPGETRTVEVTFTVNAGTLGNVLTFLGQVFNTNLPTDPDSTPNNFTGTPAEDDEFSVSTTVEEAVTEPEEPEEEETESEATVTETGTETEGNGGETGVTVAGTTEVIIDFEIFLPFLPPGEISDTITEVRNPTGTPWENVVVIWTLPGEVEIVGSSTNVGTLTITQATGPLGPPLEVQGGPPDDPFSLTNRPRSQRGFERVRQQQAPSGLQQTIIRLEAPRLNPGEAIQVGLDVQVRQGVRTPYVLTGDACLTFTGRTTPVCDTITIASAQQLPATGETPAWRNQLIAVIVALVLLIGGGYGAWRLRRAVMGALMLAVLGLALGMSAATVTAQGPPGGDDDACPVLVESALQAVDEFCAGNTDRNEVCYGNIEIDAFFRGSPAPAFVTPGDVAGITRLETMRMSGMDVTNDLWGVALMRVQANLPDTLPGQNVQMLLFGNVELENRSDAIAYPATVNGPQAANLRLQASTDASVLRSLAAGSTVTATSRNANSDWLRVRVDGVTGWVAASLLSVDGEVATLPVAGSTEEPQFGPMQAFYFRPGIGNATECLAAPEDGFTVQTPEGVGNVQLNVNGVDVQLGSTGWFTLRRDPNTNQLLLDINMVEGRARIEANGVAQYASAGQQITIPLTEDFLPAGPPSFPRPYDGREANLPVEQLDREITIPPPLNFDPDAPLIETVSVEQATPTRTVEDIFFRDANGDAQTLNARVISSNLSDATVEFEGLAINIPPAQQQEGAILNRETVCEGLPEGEEVRALLGISITDAAGNESQPVEYRITCTG